MLALGKVLLLVDVAEIDGGDVGVGAVDDLDEFLEGGAAGLDVHEVDPAELEEDPNGVDEVQAPGVATKTGFLVTSPGLKGERVGVVVEEKSALDEDVEDHETLGTERVGENLDGITDQETRPRGGVEELEEPDEEDHSVVGSRRVVLLVETASESPDDQSTAHTTGGEEEGRATTELVDHHGEGDGDNHSHGGRASVQTKTSRRVADTGVLVQNRSVVGNDGIAGPLGEDTERDDDHETVAVTTGFEEVNVLGRGVGDLLELDGVADFAELELDGGVVGIAVGVVLGENVEGLVVAVLGDEETRRLGDPFEMSVFLSPTFPSEESRKNLHHRKRSWTKEGAP